MTSIAVQCISMEVARGSSSSNGGQRIHGTVQGEAGDTALGTSGDTALGTPTKSALGTPGDTTLGTPGNTGIGTPSDTVLQATNGTALDTSINATSCGENTDTPAFDATTISKPSAVGTMTLTNEPGDARPADLASETDPLDPNGRCCKSPDTAGNGDNIMMAEKEEDKGSSSSIWLLYISRALTAWGDRLWAFGLGMFLFRIQPDSLLLMAGYGLAKSLTSILLDAALGAWIDRTGRLRSVEYRYLSVVFLSSRYVDAWMGQ